jgi:geranylgeranyl reductase family protein
VTALAHAADVAVIGGGPAGSTAARRLAASGLGVLLFEAESWPRIKPCGGALTTRALSLLPAGYEDLVEARPRGFTFTGPQGSATVTADDPYCHTVRRVRLDAWLFDEAVRAGAEGHAGEAVTGLTADGRGFRLTTRRGTYRTRYVVGADGAKGVSARLLGLRSGRRGAALEVEGEVPGRLYARFQDRCEVDVSGAPWGYCWVIPKGDRVLNIGVGSFRPTRLKLRARLDAYLGALGLKPLTPLAHPLPYRWTRARLSRGRALAVGDAAGAMDPFSAEGIYHALVTGTWAAEAVREAAQADLDTLEAYDRRLASELWPLHREASLMARLFYPFPGFWAGVFVRDQTLLQQYLAVADGRDRYQRLVGATRQSLLKYRGPALWQRSPAGGN